MKLTCTRKVKVLLLAMPNVFYGFDRCTKLPNHGLASIAGHLNLSKCEVLIVDLVVVKGNLRKYIIRLLQSFNPDIVGMSCMSFQYRTALEIAKMVKLWNKDVKVVFGGYHPTLMYQEIAESPDAEFIDFIVRGEGEKGFPTLINAIIEKDRFNQIPGLSYKLDNTFHHNPPAELIDLSDLKHPLRESRLFKNRFHGFGIPIDTVETSRGCWLNCNFCTITKMYGKSFRKFPINWVIEDIRRAKSFGAKMIFFVDDNITLDIEHFENICDAIIASKLNHLHYIVQASVKGIASNPQLVTKMARAGFKIVFLGIENYSPRQLSFFSKDYLKQEMVQAAVSYLKENKIMTLGGFILANPDDRVEDLWANCNFAKHLKLDGVFFFTATPYPKTKLREILTAQNLITNPDDFSTYDGSNANVRTKFLSPSEIEFNIWQMYNRFTDANYLKYNLIKHHYPYYFLKLLWSALPRAIYQSCLTLLRLRDETYFFRKAKERERKRRRKWLLN